MTSRKVWRQGCDSLPQYVPRPIVKKHPDGSFPLPKFSSQRIISHIRPQGPHSKSVESVWNKLYSHHGLTPGHTRFWECHLEDHSTSFDNQPRMLLDLQHVASFVTTFPRVVYRTFDHLNKHGPARSTLHEDHRKSVSKSRAFVNQLTHFGLLVPGHSWQHTALNSCWIS